MLKPHYFFRFMKLAGVLSLSLSIISACLCLLRKFFSFFFFSIAFGFTTRGQAASAAVGT